MIVIIEVRNMFNKIPLDKIFFVLSVLVTITGITLFIYNELGMNDIHVWLRKGVEFKYRNVIIGGWCFLIWLFKNRMDRQSTNAVNFPFPIATYFWNLMMVFGAGFVLHHSFIVFTGLVGQYAETHILLRTADAFLFSLTALSFLIIYLCVRQLVSLSFKLFRFFFP